MRRASVSVRVNNNPICEVEMESTVKNQIWKLSNSPWICIEGVDFEDGCSEIKILSKEQQIYNSTVEIINGEFKLKVALEDTLNDVDYIDIVVDGEVFSNLIKLNKLYGTVKYLDGSSVKNPIINCRLNDMIALGDENGKFEIYLDGYVKDIGVFDVGYSKTSLEPWLYNVDLKDDLRLDIIMDKAEVYGINMWRQFGSDYIHFVPMSLTRCIDSMNRGAKSEIEVSKDGESQCKLSKDDIKVYRDGELMEIVSFTEVKDYLGNHDGEVMYRNSYIVCIPRSNKDNRVIKVVVNSKYNIGGEEVVDFGEGYYIIG